MSGNSGASTPLSSSSSSTLSVPSSPSLKASQSLDPDVYLDPRIPAYHVVEFIASRKSSSSAVYVYDLAEQTGFGTLTKKWACSNAGSAQVIELQTRAGAGLSLVGRLSEGTSQDTITGGVLTAYTTPTGLAMMAPSLAHLPVARSSSRLVIQVPNVTSIGETFSLSPSLAPLSSAWSILPGNIVILLSATPQQTADFSTLSYRFIHHHVIHLFDQHSTSREKGHFIAPLPAILETSATTVSAILSDAGYKLFDIFGSSESHTAIVVLNGPLALAIAALANHITGLAVVVVNVFRPWDEAALRSAIPKTVVSVHVLDEVPNRSTQGALYVDVLSALLESDTHISVTAHRVTPPRSQEYLCKGAVLADFVASIVPNAEADHASRHSAAFKRVLLLSPPESSLSALSQLTEALFFASNALSVRSLTDYDVFSNPGGIAAHRLLLGPKSNHGDSYPFDASLSLDPTVCGTADFFAILDQNLLKTHSLLQYARRGAAVLLITSWSPEEVYTTLPAQAISLIIENGLRLFLFNAKEVATTLAGPKGPTADVLQVFVTLFAFVRLYLGAAASEKSVLTVVQTVLGSYVEGIAVDEVGAVAWSGLQEIELARPDKDSSPLKSFEVNAIAVEGDSGDTVVNGARLSSWHEAAKHLAFPAVYAPLLDESSEEFPRDPTLHPEAAEHTYLITCTVNRRVTPLEYDRNLFHMEFDTAGTGLKYELGESLGVHGWNDETEVLDFCKWYGVDPNRLITIPVPGYEGRMHTRTIFQVLQQQVDLFGHPPKSFYTDLAAYATSSVDRHALLFIGSPEGSATYKKLSDKDFVHFVDILMKYPSAKPGIEKLCELVGDIKPRHYSIASAQSVVGDRVDLLVVTVHWTTPDGTVRTGQCTKYLDTVKPGQKVTVSIKPGVIKAPPDPKQPIIMAGLGTGVAPFRALLQYLEAQVAQGIEIGPVYYYFGSRHQASEYLYGEEIEAFILDGIVTHAGLAFSRDSAQKVYIQHKMVEDSEVLSQALREKEGIFYLCGPTWPVPDVFDALVTAIVKSYGIGELEASEYLEGLKEEARYVLEVYD